MDARAQDALTRLARHLLELGARYGVASGRGIELDVDRLWTVAAGAD